MPKKRKAANKKKMPMKPPPGMHDMGGGHKMKDSVMESMMRDEGRAKKKPQPKRRK